MTSPRINLRLSLLAGLLGLGAATSSFAVGPEGPPRDPAPWWNTEWPTRKKITLDTSGAGLAIAEPIGPVTVLVRLHDGVFDFMGSKDDGGDLRFLDYEGKNVLPHHIEKWDPLMNEAYIWVKLPEVRPGAKTEIWMYSGNQIAATPSEGLKGSYDEATVVVYHFADAARASTDSSATGATATGTPPPAAGSLISGGLRVFGQTPITVPAMPPLEWAPGVPMTLTMWVKPSALQPNAALFSRRDGANAFILGMDNGIPFVELNKQRSTPGAALAAGAWHHIAVVADAGNFTLHVAGKSYGVLAAPMPAFKGVSEIGKDSSPAASGLVGFTGEIDEVQIAKTARPAGYLRFVAANQGSSSDAAKLLVPGFDEAADHKEESELAKHANLIKDISKDLTLDGWIVIYLCAILAVVGWAIAAGKMMYLNTIEKASKEFTKRWEKISSDLTALDHDNEESIKTLGGTASAKSQRLMRKSPLYQIYHIGSEEIKQRLQSVRELTLNNAEVKVSKGLSGRSIQAIKATLHGGLVRETQKLNGKLVFLTIGIAGGPYLGLLGTVIGVMITFAVIAKTGEVEVNSIAPGIAGALLATVAGLAVAIPALFIYSYLSSRIKDVVLNMETFIDEFIAKMAEHHKEA